MELNVGERVMLLNMLPEKGDILTLRIVRELREELSFDEEEHERLSIVVADGRVSWRDDGSTKAVELGTKANRLIVDTLEGLNTKGELTQAHLTLCDKFGIE